MSQTIKDYFRSRKRRAIAGLGFGAVVAATAVALVVAGVGGRRYQAIWLGGAMLGVIGMFIALLYFDRTRCPKCLARIGPYNSNFNYCPQCGVRLDTPAPLPR